jgi:hypothetical protein
MKQFEMPEVNVFNVAFEVIANNDTEDTSGLGWE